MSQPQTIFATIDEVPCSACGIRFWVDGFWVKSKREDGSSFYCPNGHKLSWRETDVDRLRKQLADKEAELVRQKERIEQRDRTNAALRGQITRVKNRVQHGVCPCCKRTFSQLARHMAAKHPDWKDQEVG